MSTTQADVRKELEYLLKEAGKEATTLLAEAMEEGVHLLYKRYVSEAYLMKKMGREKAIQLLGASAIEELENAWQAVESDIRWGLRVNKAVTDSPLIPSPLSLSPEPGRNPEPPASGLLRACWPRLSRGRWGERAGRLCRFSGQAESTPAEKPGFSRQR